MYEIYIATCMPQYVVCFTNKLEKKLLTKM